MPAFFLPSPLDKDVFLAIIRNIFPSLTVETGTNLDTPAVNRNDDACHSP